MPPLASWRAADGRGRILLGVRGLENGILLVLRSVLRRAGAVVAKTFTLTCVDGVRFGAGPPLMA
jgi:hypothetical protein